MTFEEYLAVPYVLRVAAVRGADGRWLRRAEYPELPGCFGEGLSPEEAMADLDRNRERMVRELLAAGAEIPVPRRPLERLMRRGTGSRLGGFRARAGLKPAPTTATPNTRSGFPRVQGRASKP